MSKRTERERREKGQHRVKKIDRDIRPRWKDAKNQTINDMFDGAVGPWMIVMPGLFMELLFLSLSLEGSSSIFVFFMKLLLYILSTHNNCQRIRITQPFFTSSRQPH